MKLLNRSGDIIIGTDQGLNILSKESNSFQRFVSETSATDGSLNVISKLSDDMVLIGYDSALKIFNYKTKTFTHIDSFKGVFINDILTFSNNNLSMIDEEAIEISDDDAMPGLTEHEDDGDAEGSFALVEWQPRY